MEASSDGEEVSYGIGEGAMTDVKHIEVLARATFKAWERVRALEMVNTPVEYLKREQAFVDLAKARHEAVETQKLLDARIMS